MGRELASVLRPALKSCHAASGSVTPAAAATTSGCSDLWRCARAAMAEAAAPEAPPPLRVVAKAERRPETNDAACGVRHAAVQLRKG